MRDDILRKLQKLQSMMIGGTEHERANAQRLFDRMIEKYDVSTDELEKKEERTINTKAETFRYIAHICRFLGIEVYTYMGKPKGPIYATTTKQEYELIIDLSNQVEAVLKQRKKAAKIQVDSYMAGFVSSCYPLADKEPDCPECGQGATYSTVDRRYYCSHCGWKGKKLRRREFDAESYYSGKESSGTMITSHA